MILHHKDGCEIGSDGTQWWHKDDQLHRLDGPAVIYPDGSASYYQHDRYHRLDGPAVDWCRGGKIFQRWYYKGEYVPCQTQEEFERWLRLKAFW